MIPRLRLLFLGMWLVVLGSNARAQNILIVPSTGPTTASSPTLRGAIQQTKETGTVYLRLDTTKAATGLLIPNGTSAVMIGTPTNVFSNLDVFIAAEPRVKSLADDISNTISSETPDNHSVLYDLQKKFLQRKIPKIVSPLESVRLLQASEHLQGTQLAEVRGTVGTLTVNESIAVSLSRAAATESQWLDERAVQFMASREILKDVSSRSAAAQALAQAYGDVIDAFGQALDTPANRDRVATYVEAARKFKELYVARWPEIKNDSSVRSAVAQVHNGLARQRVLKAQYGVVTNFPPPSYEQVFFFSRHVVTIRGDGANICSGIALSKTWVTTAGHCLENRSWQDLRVTFDLDGRGKQSRPLKVLDVWPDPPPGSKGLDKIDFAFLRVDTDPTVDGLFEELQKQIEAKPFGAQPLCIRTTPVSYKEPVFAVGYPVGAVKTVHDYAYVWFPFKVSEDLFNRLSAEAYAQAQLVGKAAGRPQYAESVQKDLEDAYRTTKMESGQAFHYYYGAAYGTSARPSFGIDTDTSHGDSGSPVFDRQGPCIVGIFTGGQRDTLVATEATWREHEFAVPISEVLTYMSAVDDSQASAGRTLDADLLAARRELRQRLKEITDSR
jgi:hypothetical protein